MSLTESAVEFVEMQATRLRGVRKKPRIVYPEGGDPRILEAAAKLAAEGLVQPVLVGKKPANAPNGVSFADPEGCPKRERYASILHERRKAKGMTPAEAGELARRPLYYSCLMVANGDAEGFVGGASNSTGDTVRAALHCIGMKAGVKIVSTFMVLCARDRSYGVRGRLVIADPAMVVAPNAVELAEIALATAESARGMLETEPAVAMLSFSTKGSAKHAEADKVIEACRIVKARNPELQVDGELQADAALVPSVGAFKSPGSTVAGKANTLIFPNLDAANIGYKLVERLGGAVAYGPFLQGLARPANDLSRGCSAGDVYGVSLVTALQQPSA